MDNFKKILNSNYIILLVLLFISLSYLLYTQIPSEKIANLAGFMSATGTLGILILTAFYVVFTNRQIAELQKQRQLQFQPLPNITIDDAAISQPRLLIAPYKKEGGLSSGFDIFIKYNIENIGNASAVLVDVVTKIKGKNIKEEDDGQYWAQRLHVIKEKEEIIFVDDIRETSSDILKAFNNKISKSGCPKQNMFDIIVHVKIFYRNVLGTPFLLTLDNVINVSGKHKETLTDWIAMMDSFEQEFSSDITRYKTVFQRDKKESREVYKKIQDSYKKKSKQQIIPLNVRPWPISFNITPLEEHEANNFIKNMHHSLPGNIDMQKFIFADKDKDLHTYITKRYS